MVDAKLFMAAERNGYNGQIFEALKNRFPEISEHVISQTLQSVVSFVKLFPVPVSGSLFGLFGQCGHFIERSEKRKCGTTLVEPCMYCYFLRERPHSLGCVKYIAEVLFSDSNITCLKACIV